jgi:ankyrin repeat protein
VNNKVDKGGNALTLVCNCYKKENLIDIVQLLVEKNIDINCKDDKGCNAFHLVCFHSPKPLLNDLVRLLVQHQIDKEAKHFVVRLHVP